ncbi:MAG: hypothetical protein J7L38_02490 [Thermoproteales archaeon]|nr:hypothetical protein [Thermoproteales archaeon]
MSEEVKKEVPEKAFTVKSTVIGILGCIALVFADAILGPITGFVATAEISVMTVVLLAILQMFLKFKMSYAEYSVIYAMIYGAAASYGSWFTFIFFFVRHATYPSWLPQYAQFVPEFFTLPRELYDMALEGGHFPPYAQLMVPTFTGLALLLLLAVIGIFATAPLRRQIVEIERLPFPATTAAFTAVSLAVEPPPVEERVPVLGSRRNWLLLGLLLGFVLVCFSSGYLVETLFPGAIVLPHYIGDEPYSSGILWGLLPGAALGLDLSGFFTWSWFLYFSPMDALITVAFMTLLVNFVITPLQIQAGIIEYDPSFTIDDLYYAIAWFSEGYKYHVLGSALLIGGVLGGYIAAWKYIVESLKDKKPEPGFISPQLQWILSIVMVIILTGVIAAFGGPVIPAFIMALFLVYILQMWAIRGLGEVNLQFTWIAHAFYPVGGIASALGLINSGELNQALAGFIMGSTLYERGDVSPSAFFESSRFAFLGKVRKINVILIAIFIGLIIGGLGGALVEQYLQFQYGLTHGTFGAYYYWYLFLRVHYIRYLNLQGFHRYGFPYDERFAVYVLLIVLGALIPALRARVAFPIPFSPIAAGLTLLMSSWANIDWGYQFLIILIVKWFILKLGGTRLDEQVARPLFAGLAAGAMFGSVISGVAAAWVAIYGPR